MNGKLFKIFWGGVLGLLIPMTVVAQSVEQIDLDASGVVDFSDFLHFAQAFGSSQVVFDFDRSGVVDFSDFTAFVSLFGQTRKKEITVSLADGVTMEMVWISPGIFEMGLTEKESQLLLLNASLRRQVTIDRGFYLGKYEVTQAQFLAVTKRGHGESELALARPNHPSVYLIWQDTQDFMDVLNTTSEGVYFRLPTEAEWEYACRAGTQTRWSFGDDDTLLGDYAWYKTNTTGVGEPYAHQVGTKLPNPWGLYDMHGNVAERVAGDDPFVESVFVKGGDITAVRSEGFMAAYQGRSSSYQHNIGFRLVRTADF